MALEQIQNPGDVKRLAEEELPQLADELRRRILEVVSRNGGHLSSNLGAVELAVALHYVFDPPSDKIVWDVSHQSYAHKLLSGRNAEFNTLRKFGGISGFQTPAESACDPCYAGHAGSAISSALGISAALQATGSRDFAIAVVGDGALNCGLSFEALNNAKSCGSRLIIVLNDNRMSISGNVGALPSYLHRLITARKFVGAKKFAHKIVDALPGRNVLLRVIRRAEGLTKSALLPGAVFEELGVRYLGPVNGHDLPALVRTFQHVKNSGEFPVLIHVYTRKGKGYAPAEADPEAFHGVGGFDLASGELPPGKPNSYTNIFGEALAELADAHADVVAVSAAMTYSTGVRKMRERHPKRVFDVGIAEGHAVTFAGGLATQGLRPVVAIYATFIQRGLDNIFQDVCLGNLPVIFCLDRAGAVEDGPTHDGVYDLGFLRAMPNLTIMQPCTKEELRAMLDFAYDLKSPVVIRYPRGCAGRGCEFEELRLGKAQVVRAGEKAALWALGREVDSALLTADELEKTHGVSCEVVNARFVKPLDVELLRQQRERGMVIAALEDHSRIGGLASALADAGAGEVLSFGWSDEPLAHGDPEKLRELHHLTPAEVAKNIADSLR